MTADLEARQGGGEEAGVRRRSCLLPACSAPPIPPHEEPLDPGALGGLFTWTGTPEAMTKSHTYIMEVSLTGWHSAWHVKVALKMSVAQ